MSTDLIEKIAAYLQEREAPVAATDLAERFLKIGRIHPHMAENLVATLLRPHRQFVCASDGLWTLAQPDFSFILAKIYPESCSMFRLHSLHLSTYCDGVFSRDAQFRFDYAVAALRRTVHSIRDYIGEHPILFDGFGNQRSNFAWLLAQTGDWGARPVLSLVKIARKLFAGRSFSSSEDLSALLLGTFQVGEPGVEFENYKAQALAIFALLREAEITTLASLRQFVQSRFMPDFSRFAFDVDDIANISNSPGVYIMRDAAENVIYVGKAKNLRRRLQSYFHAGDGAEAKLLAIWQRLDTISVIETGSELEALLLEYDLIRAHEPPINRQYGVHDRHPYRGERYSRIILLRAADENRVQIVLLNPAGRLKMVQVARRAADVRALRADIREVFQRPESDPAQRAKIEIAMSWLAQNSDHVSSIDLRRVTSVAEIVRLLQAHVAAFDPHARLVVY
ncbi:GIY-YIG nuclease family protein [candidate division KSB1 bacterium]|nr:GIY-YIG nuclease family protein [candidate division KSB1 bacterium]